MRLEERKVAVADLRVGMYVCRLDCEWVDMPYPLQGLMVAGADDIAGLAAYCQHVYVDIELGLAPDDTRQRLPSQPRRSYTAEETETLVNSVAWVDTAEFDDELPRARDAQLRAGEFAARVLDDVRAGRAIATEDVRQAVEPMVRSVLRNMDAFMWLESLRKRDNYDYQHAINCSALAAAFGRHVGFPEDVLIDLATGGLLLDIGKLRIDGELFARNGALTREETATVERHVELGLALIDASDPLPPHVEQMIRTHHERADGTGYPQRMEAEDIPLLGRIAAVIDSYDAMTSERSHAPARSRHDALQELYRERNSRYASEVVEQFMQCLSVYPTGSLVELSDGRVAVVMAQNAARRLRPRVMVLTDTGKTLAAQFVSLDLMTQPDGRAGVSIAAALQTGAYGLDPTELYL